MSRIRKLKTNSTADKLLDFRERLRTHFRKLRAGKPTFQPHPNEFQDVHRRFAELILGEELARHGKTLEADEKRKHMEAQNG